MCRSVVDSCNKNRYRFNNIVAVEIVWLVVVASRYLTGLSDYLLGFDSIVVLA